MFSLLLEKASLLKIELSAKTVLKFRPFENVAHLVSALVFYMLADLMTSDDYRISWVNDLDVVIEEGGVIYATLAIVLVPPGLFKCWEWILSKG